MMNTHSAAGKSGAAEKYGDAEKSGVAENRGSKVRKSGTVGSTKKKRDEVNEIFSTCPLQNRYFVLSM